MKPSTAARREPVTNGSVVCDHQVAAPVEEAASDVPRILTPTHKKTERLRRFRDAGFTSFPFFNSLFFSFASRAQQTQQLLAQDEQKDFLPFLFRYISAVLRAE